MIPFGGYVWPALEDTDFRRLPAYKRITFALGGPIANIVAAFGGLFVIGLSQFRLTAAQALSFAATHLLIGLQQQLHGLSTLFADLGRVSGIEAPVTLVGWALVMVLMVCLTIQDVGRLVA